mmetsp:Transcript_11864/g.25096  ORF Transcript_11864/g.25096 Transcript_11864/m.25096 type:complete len:93 (-) Transcript_11864:16-294(-)
MDFLPGRGLRTVGGDCSSSREGGMSGTSMVGRFSIFMMSIDIKQRSEATRKCVVLWYVMQTDWIFGHGVAHEGWKKWNPILCSINEVSLPPT